MANAERSRPELATSSPSVEFTVPIEPGHVLAFSRAIGDPAATAAFATSDPEIGVLAPPTFAMVADQFDPTFARRPFPGRPWPTSIWAGPDEGPEATAAGPPARSPFHVEQAFEYRRHPHGGEVLTARRLPLRRWTKQGRRGGRLEFIEAVTDLVDGSGALVVRATWLDVLTEASHASLSSETGTSGTAAAAGSSEPAGVPGAEVHPPGSTVVTLVEAVTRTQFVMYAAAAGDFHPLHHDDDFAHRHGYPSVFAPGMLTMGMTGRAVTAVVGADRLTGFRGRLTAQVWPGDTLTATVSAPAPAPAHVHVTVPVTVPASAGSGDDLVAVVVRTVNQDGVVVFDGTATARSR